MSVNLLCPKCQTEGQGKFCSNCGTAYKIDKSEFYQLLQSKFKDRAFLDLKNPEELKDEMRLDLFAHYFGENADYFQGIYGRSSYYFIMSITKLVFFLKADEYSFEELHGLIDSLSADIDRLRDELGFDDKNNLRIAFYFIFEEPVSDEYFEKIYTLNNNFRNPFIKKSKHRFQVNERKDRAIFFTSFGVDIEQMRVSGYSIDVTKSEIRELISQVTGKEVSEEAPKHWHDKLISKVMDQLPDKSFVQEQLRMIFSPTLLAFLILKDRITTLKFVTFFGAFAAVSQVLNDWVPERANSLGQLLSLTDFDILNVLLAFIPMFVLSLILHGGFRLIKGTATFKQTMTATFISSVLFIVVLQLVTILYENDVRTVGTSVKLSAVVTSIVFSMFYLGSLFRRIHQVSVFKAGILTSVVFAVASVAGSFISMDSLSDEIDTVEQIYDATGADDLLESKDDKM